MKKILIVNANYYKDISKDLILKAKTILNKRKFLLRLIHVPGIFEIPITIRKNIKKYDGFVVLGCVIKGETPHFELICNSTFASIIQISLDFNKPITNGIITALNMKQARQRSSIKINRNKPNKGIEAAEALISVLENAPKKI